jgi:hypothetical protein
MRFGCIGPSSSAIIFGQVAQAKAATTWFSSARLLAAASLAVL